MFKIAQFVIIVLLLTLTCVFFLKFNLVKLSVQKSALGNDLTPPGPAQFSETPPLETSDKVSTLVGMAEADSTLKILNNDKVIIEVKIGESAKFNTTIPLELGDNNISLVVEDKSGNQSEQASRLKIVRN